MADDFPTAARRRPLEPRVYRTRRIAALLVVALIVTGGYFGLRTLLTSGSESAGDPVGDSTTSAPAGTGAPGTGAPGTGDVTGDSGAVGPVATPSSIAATPTEPPATVPAAATGTPTPDNPAHLLVVGDSEAGGFAPYLKPMLQETGLVEDSLAFKSSTGLARPDFYNWPEELRRVLAEQNPDIVVAMFGGNDGQGLSTLDGTFIVNSPTPENKAEWITEYRARVAEILDIMLTGGRQVIWVGIPNGPGDLSARIAIQNEAVKAELANYPQVRFVDAWQLFSGRNGNYAVRVVDPTDGVGKLVRNADDGFHLNADGAGILAHAVLQQVKAILTERGATL